jgi:cell division protein FtsZ
VKKPQAAPIVQQPADDVVEEVEFDMDFSGSSDDDIDRMENTPAFKRRKINMRPQDGREERKISRFSLTPGDDNDIFINENNSYLHDNVD